MSLLEDGLMAVVVALALEEPYVALAAVIVLLAAGIGADLPDLEPDQARLGGAAAARVGPRAAAAGLAPSPGS